MDLDRFCKIVSVITVVVLKEVNVAFVMWSWGKHWDRPGCAVWVGLAAGADVAWTRCASRFLPTALRRVGRLHSRQTNTFWLERNTHKTHITLMHWIHHSFPIPSHSALLTFPGLLNSQTVDSAGQPPLLVSQGLMGRQCLPSPLNPSSHSHWNFPSLNEHFALASQIPCEHTPGTW